MRIRLPITTPPDASGHSWCVTVGALRCDGCGKTVPNEFTSGWRQLQPVPPQVQHDVKHYCDGCWPEVGKQRTTVEAGAGA